MVSIVCPICNSNSTNIYTKNFGGYELRECNNCHVAFSNPFKGPIEDFYTQAEDHSSKDRHTNLTPWHKIHPSRHSENLKNGNGKLLLDMGCGNGSFLEFAAQQGFDVTGIDLDITSLNGAKTRKYNTRADFYNMTLSEYHKKFPEKKYDIITAFEVVEHLDNPKEIIELINLMLKPGGYFIGSLPNLKRAWLKQVNMVYEVPPYHLTYWTTKTWKNALEQFFNFQTTYTKNNVFYGYLSYIFKHKALVRFNWETKKNIGSHIIRSFFSITGFFEQNIQKLVDDSASFYFEMKKNKA